MDGKTMAKEFMAMPVIEVAKFMADLEVGGIRITITRSDSPVNSKPCRLYLDLTTGLAGQKVKAVRVLKTMLEVTLSDALKIHSECDGLKVNLGTFDTRLQAENQADLYLDNLRRQIEEDEKRDAKEYGYTTQSSYRSYLTKDIFLFVE